MTEFVPVARVADIPDPGKAVFELGDRLVVLFHVQGRFYCLDDVCTHDGGPLGEGTLCDHQIACPRHGAKFDIRTGDALTMPATEATIAHEVKIEGDQIFIKINEQ
jgi:3-phenylpropionate/trans-cinnamate dioxygenase ferredoxin subunit